MLLKTQTNPQSATTAQNSSNAKAAGNNGATPTAKATVAALATAKEVLRNGGTQVAAAAAAKEVARWVLQEERAQQQQRQRRRRSSVAEEREDEAATMATAVMRLVLQGQHGDALPSSPGAWSSADDSEASEGGDVEVEMVHRERPGPDGHHPATARPAAAAMPTITTGSTATHKTSFLSAEGAYVANQDLRNGHRRLMRRLVRGGAPVGEGDSATTAARLAKGLEELKKSWEGMTDKYLVTA